MAVLVQCPQCTASIRAGSRYAGKQIHCPQCGAAVHVPGQAAAQPPAESDAAAPIIQVDESQSDWRKRVATRKKARPAGAGRRSRRSSTIGWWLAAGGGVAVLVVVWAVIVASDAKDDPGQLADEPAQRAPANEADAPGDSSPADELASAAAAPEDGLEEMLQPGDRPEPPSPAGEDDSAAVADDDARSEPPPRGRNDEPPTVGRVRPASKPSASETGEKPAAASVVVSKAAATDDAATDDAPAGEPQTPEDLLAKHGLRIVAKRVAHDDEPKLAAALNEAGRLKSRLFTAVREWRKGRVQQAALKNQLVNLTKLHGRKSLELARLNAVNPNNVTENNKLVGQLNAIDAQVKLLTENREKHTAHVEKLRARAIDIQEQYVERILDARKAADAIERTFVETADDDRVAAALAQLGSAAGETYELKPSRTLARAQRDLKSLEETIASNTISLRREGNSYYASVVLNGKHTVEMVVDSGATSISLPYEMAVKCGLTPDESAPEIVLELADGSRIPGRLVTARSVRVGKFTVDNVECVVLGPQAVRAEALLGMSYLGNFRFELDSAASTLDLIQLDADEKTSRSRR